MDRYIAANRGVWDDWTEHDVTPASFKVDAFRAGEEVLQDFEVEEVGDVSGKSLLHLQCHFGLDTMGWARRGARATGLDFSPVAIDRARALASELGVDARFVCSDVYGAPDHIDETFDVVYTSFGVLAWLPDLARWAGVIAGMLNAGGLFYIAEYHPITFVFDSDESSSAPVVRHPYFPRSEPIEMRAPGGDPQYAWPYSLGRVVTALADAGLWIEFLHEFPFSESQHLPMLEPDEDGRWRLPSSVEGELPLMFSIRATKPV